MQRRDYETIHTTELFIIQQRDNKTIYSAILFIKQQSSSLIRAAVQECNQLAQSHVTDRIIYIILYILIIMINTA